MGTFTSRSAVCGGGAVVTAAGKLRPKVLAIGAHLLEAASATSSCATGGRRAGAPERSREPARRGARRLPERRGCRPASSRSWRRPATTTPAAGPTRTAPTPRIVEVDPETGQFEFLRYCVVEDCGTMINPMVVDGQVHGGVAQGIGGAGIRGDGLRRRWPAPDGELHGLPDADGAGGPAIEVAPPDYPVAVHAARHQGHGRGRHGLPGQRPGLRALPTPCGPSACASPSCRSRPRRCSARSRRRGARRTPAGPNDVKLGVQRLR